MILKGVIRRRYADPMRIPGEGTVLRAIYDKLRAGETIFLRDHVVKGAYSRVVEQLRNIYGCELHVAKGGGWLMTGRYNNADFIPLDQLTEDQ